MNDKKLIDVNWENFVSNDENIDLFFSFLYNKYSTELYAYGISMGYPEEICKDAIHDVFFELYTSRKRLKNVDNRGAYLFRSYKNRIFDYLKKNNKNTDIDKIDITGFIVNTTALDTIVDNETTNSLLSLVNNLLNSLTDHQREAVYLRYMQNMNYDEIATILGITNNSARKLVYRSLESLRDKTKNLNSNDYY
jgi:RNA polymerase sigma factor (sigma-70 family)